MKKGTSSRNTLLVLVFAVSALFAYGCASTPAGLKTMKNIESGVILTSYENLEIKTEANNVLINDYEMERISNHIKSKLLEQKAGCFKEIGKNCSSPSTLVLKINFTRYDKGSAFARAMLAGLGQIHIDAEVILEDKSTSKLISKHQVNKTFAWGGIYGGSTRIEDVEPAFAETVANIILQKES